MTSYRRQDALVTLLGLGLLAAWDVAGLDLPLVRSLGDPSGFRLRNVAALQWLHSGGRAVAWVVLAWMAWLAWFGWFGGASRQQPTNTARAAMARQRSPPHRRYWFSVTLLCLLLINVIKHASTTSCPWDLAEFGGAAQHISHWALWARDGGPGQCFPSGHTSAAAAFVSLYFLHRQTDPQRAKTYLTAVCAAGVVFSLTQIVRGAHYPSHALWSAWLCWAVCSTADAWRTRQRQLQVLPPA